jgi:hypothetical protein
LLARGAGSGVDDARYVHAPGGFIAFTFDLQLPNHSTHTGTFFATLGGLTIRAHNESEFGGGVQLALGPGVFDPRTAKILGVRRETLPSDVDLYADTLSDDSEPYREVAAFGYMDIQAEVPEPSVLLLTSTGILVGIRRRQKPLRK